MLVGMSLFIRLLAPQLGLLPAGLGYDSAQGSDSCFHQEAYEYTSMHRLFLKMTTILPQTRILREPTGGPQYFPEQRPYSAWVGPFQGYKGG